MEGSEDETALVDPRDYDTEGLIKRIWGPERDEPEPPSAIGITPLRERQNRELAAALTAYLKRCIPNTDANAPTSLLPVADADALDGDP